jgi:hypothetical protein
MSIPINEVYDRLAVGLRDHLSQDESTEIGRNHNTLFLRIGGQIFTIVVEERRWLHNVPDPLTAAKDFMAALPIPWPLSKPGIDSKAD